MIEDNMNLENVIILFSSSGLYPKVSSRGAFTRIIPTNIVRRNKGKPGIFEVSRKL